MKQVRRIKEWQRTRLSKKERSELLQFNYALYGVKELPAKSNVPAKETPTFSYVDSHGVEQNLDLTKVKNLGDTQWAEAQKLFPNATQCYIGQEGIPFDEEGRPNVINQNLVILEARRMTKGDYGPWFFLRCAHPELGEISTPAPGQIANEAVAGMSGVSLESGETVKASELPVWARFEFVKGGKYGGYFVIYPALEQADVSDE